MNADSPLTSKNSSPQLLFWIKYSTIALSLMCEAACLDCADRIHVLAQVRVEAIAKPASASGYAHSRCRSPSGAASLSP